VKPVLYNTKKKRRMTMEIIIDCDNKGLAKAIADKLSEETGVARDKFKESTDDVDTSVDATRDQSGS
jgi:ACT domain-containing protein